MCDVNTRLAHRQMKMFCCASGEAVSDWGEACRKVSNGTWQAAMIHHVHNEARNECCHHPVCNRQQQRMGHIHHFWQHATPRNFYLISSDNFIITFLSCISWLATTWCSKSKKEKWLWNDSTFYAVPFDLCAKIRKRICTYLYKKFGEFL